MRISDWSSDVCSSDLFSVPALPMAAMNLSLAVFLPQFYATHTAIPLTMIGFIFMMVRLGDLVFDPLLGIAIDRTATRIGRFRPWMLAGAPTVMMGAWLAYFRSGEHTSELQSLMRN